MIFCSLRTKNKEIGLIAFKLNTLVATTFIPITSQFTTYPPIISISLLSQFVKLTEIDDTDIHYQRELSRRNTSTWISWIVLYSNWKTTNHDHELNKLPWICRKHLTLCYIPFCLTTYLAPKSLFGNAGYATIYVE